MHVKPLNDVKSHRFEIYNDFAILLTFYYLPLFTDYVASPVTRFSFGWQIMFIQAVSVVINMIPVLINLVKGIFMGAKKFAHFVRRLISNKGNFRKTLAEMDW